MIELKKFRCAMAVNATAVYHVANGVITGTDVLGFTPVVGSQRRCGARVFLPVSHWARLA